MCLLRAIGPQQRHLTREANRIIKSRLLCTPGQRTERPPVPPDTSQTSIALAADDEKSGQAEESGHPHSRLVVGLLSSSPVQSRYARLLLDVPSLLSAELNACGSDRLDMYKTSQTGAQRRASELVWTLPEWSPVLYRDNDSADDRGLLSVLGKE